MARCESKTGVSEGMPEDTCEADLWDEDKEDKSGLASRGGEDRYEGKAGVVDDVREVVAGYVLEGTRSGV